MKTPEVPDHENEHRKQGHKPQEQHDSQYDCAGFDFSAGALFLSFCHLDCLFLTVFPESRNTHIRKSAASDALAVFEYMLRKYR